MGNIIVYVENLKRLRKDACLGPLWKKKKKTEPCRPGFITGAQALLCSRSHN